MTPIRMIELSLAAAKKRFISCTAVELMTVIGGFVGFAFSSSVSRYLRAFRWRKPSSPRLSFGFTIFFLMKDKRRFSSLPR